MTIPSQTTCLSKSFYLVSSNSAVGNRINIRIIFIIQQFNKKGSANYQKCALGLREGADEIVCAIKSARNALV